MDFGAYGKMFFPTTKNQLEVQFVGATLGWTSVLVLIASSNDGSQVEIRLQGQSVSAVLSSTN